MKISLVYPKLGGQMNKAIGSILGSFDPPLGIMYLGSFLKERGISVNLIDLSFSKDWGEYKKELLSAKPDIVGITSLSPFAHEALSAAHIAKNILPNCKIVIGGPHATALPMEIMKSQYVDFVVAGEGEITLLKLIRALENNSSPYQVKGIFYKKDNKILQTDKRECICSLDEIPFPDRELLPTWQRYLSQVPFFPYIPPYTTIMGARGCPFNCSFCQPMLRKLFGERLRLRSPQNIIKEISLLREKYKIKSLFFFDDTFTAVPKWTEEICNGFIQNKWNIVWGANSRVNTLSYALAKKMKQAGCIYVAFGVESGSQKILDESLNKGIKIEQIINAFDICKKTGLLSSASLMVGSPGDTRETIRETVSLVKRIKPDMIDVHFTTPTPGSFMHEKAREALNVSHKNRYQAGGMKTALSNAELEELHDEIQSEWRKSRRKEKYYNNAVRRYVFKISFLGLRHPLKYFIVLFVLASENNKIAYKLMHVLKRVYLKIFS